MGQTIIGIGYLNEGCSGAGRWDMYFADAAISGTDGTVWTIYNQSDAVSLSVWGSPTVTGVGGGVERSTNFAHNNTSYYLGDHLGTAQMEFAAGGWPVWQGQFAPFGGELHNGVAVAADQPDPTTANSYKFTGKERDTESGLDYFGARYYASSMGRWMSPDWSAKGEPVPYSKLDDPQTLNLYSYVQNNPLSRLDDDGHETLKPHEWDNKPDRPGMSNREAAYTAAGIGVGVAMLSGAGELAAVGRAAWTAATSFCLFHCGEVAAHLVDAAGPPGSSSASMWSMAPAARGLAIEAQLGGNLPQNFPTIDKFAGGVATSIKSLDLNASSYQNAGTLASTVAGYIDKVSAFTGGKLGTTVIGAGQITGRELQLAVPGAGTLAQQAALNSASSYATKQGVKLTITQVH